MKNKMDKSNLLDLKRRLIAGGISMTMATSFLTGCSLSRDKDEAYKENLIAEDNMNLLTDASKYVIKTKKTDGSENLYFTEKRSLSYIDIYLDSDEYSRYFVSQKATTSDTYFYTDVLSGEIVSVEYVNKNEYLFKDNTIDYSYAISTIVDIEPACNYAMDYIGVQETYTREEIANMMIELNEDSKVKIK